MTIGAAREHLKRAHDRIKDAAREESSSTVIGLATLARDDLASVIKEAKEAARGFKKQKDTKGQDGLPFTPNGPETHKVDDHGNVVDFKARAAGEDKEHEYREPEAKAESNGQHHEAEKKADEPLPV